MAAFNYPGCIDKVLSYEGGYQSDPNDSGNWTACKCHHGVNKGTNRGISACSYPAEDIRNMTEERAREIYRADYWDVVCGDQLPAGVDLPTFDGGVNSGCSRGAQWLQHALGVVEDGVIGPQTLAAAHAADDHVTIDRACDERLHFLKGLSTWDLYGKGWSNRVEDVRATAHSMVRPELEPDEELEKVVIAEFTVPVGVRVEVKIHTV